MSLVKRLKEGLWPADKPPIPEKGQVVIGTTEQAVGVRLTPTLKQQVSAFNEDPIIKESVLQFAQQVVSNGIFTTKNADYTVELPNKAGGGTWTAQECIEDWNKANNLDGKLLTIATELDGFGNSFWHVVDGLDYIPVQSVFNAGASKREVSVRDQYKLVLTAEYGSKTIKYGNYIHFKTNIIGTAPFGSGILYALLTTPENAPSLWTLRQSIRSAMKEGFEKFSFGNELWTFEGLSNENIVTMGGKIDEMASTGQRITTNVKGDVQLATPERTGSYDAWLKQIHDEFLMALANPSLKLGLEQGFTKATAESALSMFDSKIESLRREIRRQIEALWVQILNSSGFDGKEAGIVLNFGSDEVEYVPADLFKAVELRLVTVEEARNILRDNMKWELGSEVVETPPTEPVEEPVKVGTESADETLEELQMKNEKEKNVMLHAIIKANSEVT